MGRATKQAKDAAREASKARGPVRPKPVAGPYSVFLPEEPANFEEKNLFSEIAASIAEREPALALADAISRFTLADYSIEDVERAVFDAKDLSKFPYDVLMKRGLRAPPELTARLVALIAADRDKAEKEIESFATRLICWSPTMAMPLVAASEHERPAAEEKARRHYCCYVSTIGKEREAPRNFAKAIIRLAGLNQDAACALLRGDLVGAIAALRRQKPNVRDDVRFAGANIQTAFEWAEAIWCCFDLQWNVAFWRQKYRNGLSPIILSAKVRQSSATVQEVFSLYLKLDSQARFFRPNDELITISGNELAIMTNLIDNTKKIKITSGNSALYRALADPYFARSASNIADLLNVVKTKSSARAIDLFLENIPLAIALLAAALRFEQAERTRSERVNRILRGNGLLGLRKFRMSQVKKASLERAHTISLYLRCSVGDISPETINPPLHSDKAPPACRVTKANRELLHSLLDLARDHSGQFRPLIGRNDQQSLMDVLDQSVRYRWAKNRLGSDGGRVAT